MASNSFGQLFKITTWGESHGKAIGLVIDGCPAGIKITEAEINNALIKRAPGQNTFTSPRKEPDLAEIYSGVFNDVTTGAPISIIIHNQNANSNAYHPVQNLLRPGHANFTYQEKYGVFDYRGGGRASARETACRVAAGAIAKKILSELNIQTCAYLIGVGDINYQVQLDDEIENLQQQLSQSQLFCPDLSFETEIKKCIHAAMQKGDSIGGKIEFRTNNLPIGLGDPVYEKLEANLAKAMLSIPASKAFEVGEGFSASTMLGSQHNDLFINENDRVQTHTNHAGGTLGGISNGMPLIGRVAFKPPSSIKISQQTLDLKGQPATLTLPEGSRHDPCVAIRAVPVVDAMLSLVLVDALLMNRCVKL